MAISGDNTIVEYCNSDNDDNDSITTINKGNNNNNHHLAEPATATVTQAHYGQYIVSSAATKSIRCHRTSGSSQGQGSGGPATATKTTIVVTTAAAHREESIHVHPLKAPRF